MNVAIFCSIAPCSLYVSWRFGGKYYLHPQGRKSVEEENSMYFLIYRRYRIPMTLNDGNFFLS
jgi:hypothetical protein